jgi:hypothetical protein
LTTRVAARADAGIETAITAAAATAAMLLNCRMETPFLS